MQDSPKNTRDYIGLKKGESKNLLGIHTLKVLCDCKPLSWISVTLLNKDIANLHHRTHVLHQNTSGIGPCTWQVFHVLDTLKDHDFALKSHRENYSTNAELYIMKEVKTDTLPQYEYRESWMDDSSWSSRHPESGPIPSKESRETEKAIKWPIKVCAIFVVENMIHKLFVSCEYSSSKIKENMKTALNVFIRDVLSTSNIKLDQ
jgi:hypothetical protein